MESRAFEPATLAGFSVKNRIIRSATHEGLANGLGLPTEGLEKLYLRLARGGAGAIVTGYAAVQPDGRCPLVNMLMADHDRCVDAWRPIVDAVHAEGTAIMLQVAHCGRQTRSKVTGLPTVAPSAIRDRYYFEDRPRELSEDGIEEVIDNFVSAIRRGRDAGFDAVQLHGAHGYLLSQFLSPASNRRRDRWGGPLENRYRIVGETLSRARREVGNYPVLIKLNGYDGRRNGMRTGEAVRIAGMLEGDGCAGIEVSCGTAEDGLFMTRGEHAPIDAVFAYHSLLKRLPKPVKSLLRPFGDILSPPVKPTATYNLEAAQMIKKGVSIPVIVVGGIRTLAHIRDIIENGKADFVSMCRPFIIEPGIVNKLKEGRQDASRCIACNYCLIAAEARPLQCYYGQVRT
ncbi:MAG TPA: NADH:flavin oxidoreductase [Deltaproteobacteria bacterium]|jgi:2,4-dienoyl-CoA reductase-like NADH-dependent reductase (Old Yellow Enzyme family)|nr:NADH:flavin oxidoreductase [Deltaproteobacteria bacterium]HOI06662.1 NADH:flavin oxidoreductase [Deltaproteobacteria bacterium]